MTYLHAFTSRIDLNISARIPNQKLVFFFDLISESILSDCVGTRNGSVKAFILETKDMTVLKGSALTSVEDLGSASSRALSTDLKQETGLNLEVLPETSGRVKMESVKSGGVGIRVSCDGIRVKANSTASVSDSKCNVKLRLKIWRWTV